MHLAWIRAFRIFRHSPSAIAQHQKRKGRNKSRGLEITDRLIEHSWFRRKFGEFTWPTLVSFYRSRYMDRLGREIVARRRATPIKRNCRSARNGKGGRGGGGARSFLEKKKKRKNGPLLRRSMAADSCFSIFYELPTPSYNYVRTYTRLIASFADSGVVSHIFRHKSFLWFFNSSIYIFIYLLHNNIFSLIYYVNNITWILFCHIWVILIEKNHTHIYFRECNASLLYDVT